MLRAVRAAVGDRVYLRADANCGWTVQKAVKFMRAMHKHNVELEYLEEPLKKNATEGEWSTVADCAQQCGVPLAFDESLEPGTRWMTLSAC